MKVLLFTSKTRARHAQDNQLNLKEIPPWVAERFKISALLAQNKGTMPFSMLEELTHIEIDTLSEERFVAYRNKIVGHLVSYSNLSHYFAKEPAITVVQSLAQQFPVDHLRQPMWGQIQNDFRLLPLWEAGRLAINSYVPWPDASYLTHAQSVLMSRLLLKIAVCALLWLKERDSTYGGYRC